MLVGEDSKLSLYEIVNGQHFDAFLSVAGFDTRFVPLANSVKCTGLTPRACPLDA